MKLTKTALKSLFRNECRGDVDDFADSFYVFSTDGAVQTLSYDTTINWDVSLGWNAKVTLAGAGALSISNAFAGVQLTIEVIQDSNGSRTLSLPSGSKVVGGGGGAITLTPTANAVDLLSCYYNGSVYYWSYGLNCT